jgi:DNA-binding transcriptional LysR family regulator
MTLSTQSLAEFVALARHLNFTHAAEELHLHPSMLSQRLKALEQQLGARLVERDTHRVALTDAGQILLRHAQDILDRLTEAEALVAARHGTPIGTLRLAVPNMFGQLRLAPLIPKLMARYPALRIELSFTDRFLDLAETGHDAAVRIGAREVGGNLKVRRLASNQRLLCAAPAYLAAHGTPATPAELERHCHLHFAPQLGGPCWRLKGPNGLIEVPLEPILTADNIEALRQAALAGRGIGMFGTFVAGDDLRAGRLIPVLRGYPPVESEVSVVYRNAPLVPMRIRVLVDFLVEAFAEQTDSDNLPSV